MVLEEENEYIEEITGKIYKFKVGLARCSARMMGLEKREDDYQDKSREFLDKAEECKQDAAKTDAVCKLLLTGTFSN